MSVRDPQQARLALHPWKELATTTDAAVLLIVHTNRVVSPNARDRYGTTIELRKKARMTLYAQSDDDGRLIVGPEKSNDTAAITASTFAITSVQHFQPTVDSDGTVPLLVYTGESDCTAAQHLASAYDMVHGDDHQDRAEAKKWLREYIEFNGPGVLSADAKRDAAKAGFSERTLQRARKDLDVVYGWSGSTPSKTTWSLPANTPQPQPDAPVSPGDLPVPLVPHASVSDGTGGTGGITAGQQPVPTYATGTGWHRLPDQQKQVPVPPVPQRNGDTIDRRAGCVCVDRPTPCYFCTLAASKSSEGRIND
jgi:hypothetical protein